METLPKTAGWFVAVAHLRDTVQRTTNQVVACARVAHWRGATAKSYHDSAVELTRQADRAETLLFSQAVMTFRAAAADHMLVAEALEVIENNAGVP